jgi:predicted DNA-binding transcriptional regulator YafY
VNRTEPRLAPSLPPVTLTPEEAAAVAVALASGPDGPYAAAGRGALDKVLAVLEPDPGRREALAASTLLVRVEAARATAVRSLLEQGLARHRVLVLRYRDAQGQLSRREVEPQLLARTADHEYLVAWCREREAMRWFRQDRIQSAELSTEVAARRDPATFGAPPAADHPTHPAGRALGRAKPAAPPRLVVLPGGRS